MQIRSKGQPRLIHLPNGQTLSATREWSTVPPSMETAVKQAATYLPGIDIQEPKATPKAEKEKTP